MESLNIVECIGYLGSILVAISLTMSSMLKLRWINLIGALFFTFYSIIIHAIPVALVNGFITIIDIYYLIKIYTSHDFFKLMTTDLKNPYLKHFLSYYDKAIKHNFPDFAIDKCSGDITMLILRNMDIAGIFIAHKNEDQTLSIDLDYAIPKYQDFKTGKFLFEKNQHIFSHQGIKAIKIEKVLTKKQIPYYKHVGFEINDQGKYIKKIQQS